jgi:hypothetical protein
MKTLQGVQKSQNPSRIREKISGGTTFLYAQARTQVTEFSEERGTKVEAFENLKFFQVWKKSAKAQQEQ